MATVLLLHYADAGLKTNEGWDAVHLAAWNAHPDMVKLLLTYGAPANQKTPQGWTVIHIAAIKGDSQTLDVALMDWPAYKTKGAPSVNDADAEGNTPAFLAFRHGHRDLIETLVAKGADVKAADKDGNTLLHLVAGTGDRALALQMLLQGADANRTNTQGKTPYALASEKGDYPVAEVIRQRGGR